MCVYKYVHIHTHTDIYIIPQMGCYYNNISQLTF